MEKLQDDRPRLAVVFHNLGEFHFKLWYYFIKRILNPLGA